MKSKMFWPLALASFLAVGLHAPLRAQARDMHPIPQKTITYRASLEATAARPIVGAVLPGTMRLTLDPDGTIQGTYIPEDGHPFPVTGGVRQNGNLFLTMGRTTVNGRLMRDGTIIGSTFGPAPFDALKFVAVPKELEHPQRQG